MLGIQKLVSPVIKSKNLRNMSAFIQKLNPMTGLNDWVVQNEDYDFHQEVARASFADMLHDTERNQLYEAALKSAIEKMHAAGKKANVLDIGTGTGLLSMMAARHGADTITACEAFKPMSECALKIIALNGFQDKIVVIPKRSTDLTVGETGDLPHRCNILVTEVFDTELIGEGAFSTFSHAHKNLLEKDCIVVPQSATIYAQIIESPLAQNWNRLKDLYNNDGEVLVRVPESVKNCAGCTAVHDIQLSQLKTNDFLSIVSPVAVLRFDWSGQTPFVFDRSTISNLTVERDGKAQMVFMWWDLQMDTEGKVILSCAPVWAQKGKTAIPWRDHWMQAIYYLPREFSVKKGEEINLISCHDEYSLWFNVSKDLKITDMHYENPFCDCGVHVAFSRTRIGQINNNLRNKKFLKQLEETIDPNSCVLVLSDGCFLGLAAAKLGAKRVYHLETNHLSRKILSDFVRFNKLENVVKIVETLEELRKDDFLVDLNVVVGEPFFIGSILPWDNLLFSYLVRGMKKLLNRDVKIFPQRAVIRAVAVHFRDLHKIRSPLGSCEGFSMKCFDDLIKESSKISDENVEAQPLWEYPGIALSDVTEIASIDLIEMSETICETTGVIDVKGDAECNGVALWMDWWLDGTQKSSVSTGPVQPTEIGQEIQWDMYTRQGVNLFTSKNVQFVNYKFKFDFNAGTITFKCSNERNS